MTARRPPVIQQAVASLLVAALGGYPVRALADQGVPVQSVPPPPGYAVPQPAAPQGYAQQPAPQQQYAPQPQPVPQGYAQQPPPQQPTYAPPPPAYAPPAAAGAAAGAAVAAPGAQGYAPAPTYAPPGTQPQAPAAQGYAPAPAPGAAPAAAGAAAAMGAGAQAPAPTVQDVPAASPRLPPGAVPVPQTAAPGRTGETDLGSAPPPPPPPGYAPQAPSAQKSAPVDDRLIRLEWRPAHVEGSLGWGPMVQVPVMGPQKQPLQGRSLYTALGRNDLAEEYERRLAAKRIMGVGSALLLVSGIAVGVSAFAIHGCNPGDVKCWNDRDEQLKERFYWSGGLVLGGAVLGVASSAYSAHPVSRDELVSLIRQHNDQIRSQSGVRLGAMALPGGGGLSLAGNF